MINRLIAVILFSIISVSSAYAVEKDNARKKSIYLETFSCDRGVFALQVGPSIDWLKTLGAFTVRTEPPRAGNAEARIFKFDGLTIKMLFSDKDSGVGLITKATISKPRWDLTGGLRVGMPIKDLFLKLPIDASSQVMNIKVCGDTDCVTFLNQNGIVSEIEYSCYAG